MCPITVDKRQARDFGQLIFMSSYKTTYEITNRRIKSTEFSNCQNKEFLLMLSRSSCVGQVVSTLAFGADDPGSIPGGKIYFLAAFQCFGGHCKPSVQSAKSLSSSCFL